MQEPNKDSVQSAQDAQAQSSAEAGRSGMAAELAAEPVEQVTAELSEKLAAAEAKAAEHYDAFVRARAEMENLRRRTQEDVARAHKFAIENFAEALLPVMDSLHAALADQSAEVAKVREGVELTLRQLTSAFEKGRVIEINPVGEKFDPHRHQAIAMVPDSGHEANTVVTVLQRGYVIADRVLRPALVTVAQ